MHSSARVSLRSEGMVIHSLSEVCSPLRARHRQERSLARVWMGELADAVMESAETEVKIYS
jgi:hypothetical protein